MQRIITTPSSTSALALGPLSTLSYRSRVVDSVSRTDLDLLADAGRRRNHVEGVSTLMLLDGQAVHQWLEGPEDALARVWESVRRDPRHTAVELLGHHATPARLFGDFELRRRQWTPGPADSSHPAAAAAVELARLSTLGEHLLPLARERALLDSQGASTASRVRTVESAARRLGDMWQRDECGEFDVALGLGWLQACLRRCGVECSRQALLEDAPSVLVAPFPGEPHLFCAALDADALWRAGWHPQIEFPADAGALCKLVAGTWFDALDLSLSAAFRREHWLTRMKRAVRDLRAHSVNPQVAVIASGRLFREHPEASAEAGADHACASASQIETSIIRGLARLQQPMGDGLH